MEGVLRMVQLISAIWTGIETVCYFLFFGAFIKRRTSKTWSIAVFCGTWCAILACTNFVEIDGFSQIGPVCIAIAMSYILYQGKWYYRILSGVGCYFLFAVIDTAVGYGASLLRGVSFAELVLQKYAYLTTVTAAKLLELLVAWMIYHTRNAKERGRTAGKWLLLTLLFPLVSVILLAVMFYSFQGSKDLSVGVLISSFAVAVVNVASFYVIGRVEAATTQEKETELLKQQIALQSNSFASLEQNYRLQQKSVHEFQRHIQVLTALMESGETESVQKYLSQLQSSRSLRVFSVHSRHPVIDVILNQKYLWARENNIRMHIEVSDLSQVKISAENLVVLLSNLLDNAIEACLKLPADREIKCRLIAEENLFLSVKNTSVPIEIAGGEIRTTKGDSRNHGYGIPAVRYVLEQIGGEWLEALFEIPEQGQPHISLPRCLRGILQPLERPHYHGKHHGTDGNLRPLAGKTADRLSECNGKPQCLYLQRTHGSYFLHNRFFRRNAV